MREALWSQGWGRTVEFSSSLFWRNFVYLSLLPFLLCLVFFPLLPFLWHRRLGHVSSPRLRYFLSTGMLGSVPNINLSTCMGCKQGKDSALPLLRTLFLLLLLILCPKPILPLCYRKEDHPYMLFLTEQWKNKNKKVSVRGEYISAAFRTLLASTHFTYKALSQRSCPQLTLRSTLHPLSLFRVPQSP